MISICMLKLHTQEQTGYGASICWQTGVPVTLSLVLQKYERLLTCFFIFVSHVLYNVHLPTFQLHALPYGACMCGQVNQPASKSLPCPQSSSLAPSSSSVIHIYASKLCQPTSTRDLHQMKSSSPAQHQPSNHPHWCSQKHTMPI